MGTFSLSVDGRRFEVQTPNLDLLSAYKAAEPGRPTEKALRKLSTTCILDPDGDELATLWKDSPALPFTVGHAILRACGFVGPITILDEDEVDGEMAEVLVREEAKGLPGTLYPCIYERAARKIRYEFILRSYRENDFTAYRAKADDLTKLKELTKSVMVWGDVEAFLADSPGLYNAIPEFLAQKAGLAASIVEGE